MSAPSNRSDAFSAFDVVIVPFPYADRLAEKRRPAIVVSAPELSRKYGLAWLVMVTSADNRAWDCDVTVSDLKSAGLPAPSLIRPAKLATVDAARILRRIGRLSPKDSRALGAGLKALLG
jgi:mRNA interferase MazF